MLRRGIGACRNRPERETLAVIWSCLVLYLELAFIWGYEYEVSASGEKGMKYIELTSDCDRFYKSD